MSERSKKKYSGGDYSRFLVPSLIGIMLFMIPLKYQGEYTIPEFIEKVIYFQIFQENP